MLFSFNPLIAWIGSFFNKYLVDMSLKYAANKFLLYTSLVVILPAILKNLLSWLFELLTSQVSQANWGSMSSMVLQYSGVGAWFAVHLRLVDCLSVLVTGLVIRLTLNFIPFVG